MLAEERAERVEEWEQDVRVSRSQGVEEWREEIGYQDTVR